MKQKPTVTVGVPAYNEEANVAHLLEAVLVDSSRYVRLLEVIVVSDGSTDDTVKQARSIKDSRVSVVNHKRRLGVNRTENEIIKHARGDVLVMLNADVMPVESDFLDKITFSIRKDSSVGCVGATSFPLPPRNLFERIIANSHYMKVNLAQRINSSNNVYLCYGVARAFSKRFYTKLRWADDCPEDAYSYFACKTMGFEFVYSQQASVYFRPPFNLSEHASQSTRFVAGISQLKKHFDADFIQREYKIPKLLLIGTLLKYFWRNPFSTPAYLLITLFIRLVYGDRVYRSSYSIAPSSKKIVLYKGQRLSRV